MGHTPKAASRTSGSTDWRNAVRNLWSMEYKYPPKAGPSEMTEEKAALVLECEKRNYGPKPPIIYLDREGGVLSERGGLRTGLLIQLQLRPGRRERGTTTTLCDLPPCFLSLQPAHVPRSATRDASVFGRVGGRASR